MIRDQVSVLHVRLDLNQTIRQTTALDVFLEHTNRMPDRRLVWNVPLEPNPQPTLVLQVVQIVIQDIIVALMVHILVLLVVPALIRPVVQPDALYVHQARISH